MDCWKLAEQQFDYAKKIRRHLHMHPEVSGKERNTVRYIVEQLNEIGIPYTVVPKGGVFATIDGICDHGGKTILLRADIDALPIEEKKCNLKGPKECVSETPGVSHACGHDGHTAILLAAAKILFQHRHEINGRVLLMFERGEEGNENAYYLLKHLQDHKIRVNGSWALHLAPMVSTGQMAILDGGVMAGLYAFSATVRGRGGHGSRPDLASNPVDCFSAINTALSAYRLREVSPFDCLSYSICIVKGSELGNIIPETLQFTGSARFYDQESVGKGFRQAFHRICDHIAAAYGCEMEYDFELGPLAALINQPQCVELAREIIGQIISPDNLVKIDPWTGSESMAEVHLLYPGVFCFLGIGNQKKGTCAEAHTPEFDVDEDAFVTGIAAALGYATGFLNSDQKIEFTPYSGDLRALYSDAVDKLED